MLEVVLPQTKICSKELKAGAPVMNTNDEHSS